MEFKAVDHAIEWLEKANANLQPELLVSGDARRLLERYARVERLATYGKAALARKVDDASEVARATGTSIGRAKETVNTGQVLEESPVLDDALKHGRVSLDQASEIAKAEASAPGSAKELVEVARKEAFHVFKEKARKAKLEAEQHQDLAQRQRAVRSARSYDDELGMVHVHLALQPHVGTPIVARAEAEAARRARAAKKAAGGKAVEPFEAHLADAYAAMLSGSSVKPRSKRPELVVLVSYEVAKRGWKNVRKGEVCKIPGVGPVPPQVAREIAEDAFLSGVFFDGKDLRQIKRWSRSIPIEVATALELGDPPGFDGVACVDCGNRFRTEFDHVHPRVANGPSSNGNLKPRCWSCHQEKTERDRRAGKLRPPDP
jgi:hypothetical protein